MLSNLFVFHAAHQKCTASVKNVATIYICMTFTRDCHNPISTRHSHGRWCNAQHWLERGRHRCLSRCKMLTRMFYVPNVLRFFFFYKQQLISTDLVYANNGKKVRLKQTWQMMQEFSKHQSYERSSVLDDLHVSIISSMREQRHQHSLQKCTCIQFLERQIRNNVTVLNQDRALLRMTAED